MADSSSVPPPQAHSVRIRLPDRFLTTRARGDSSRSSSISFTSPAQPMLQSWSDNRPAVDFTQGRRRVRSLGPDSMVPASKMSRNTPLRHYESRRKKNSGKNQDAAFSPLKVDSIMSDFEPAAFSDEYDLYPKILQDVQRALHLQSRRRERILQQPHSTSDELPPSTDIPVNMSIPYASTSTATHASHSSPQYLQMTRLPSEVDFSPSTRSVSLHPVPLSSNGGATLDWTGSQSEEEKLDRRWSISRGKRRVKERMLPPSKAIVEKQDALFRDRILRIRAEASPPTVRKATIVSEQLGRRYGILYTSLASEDPAGLAQIARWHAGLGAEARAWLDSAEPLTWLKHLLDRGKQRSQWHLSALIVEEYIKAKKGVALSTPLPQSPTASFSREIPPSQHRLGSTVRQTSAPPSDSSPDSSLSRVRSSEGQVFLGRDPGSTVGTPSSYHHRNSFGGLSPASSRLNFPDIIHRFRRHPAESDEGSSSPFGSQSEDQNDSVPSGPQSKRKRRSHLSGFQLPRETAAETNSSDMPEATLPADSTFAPTRETVVSEENKPDVTISQLSRLRHKRSYRSTSLPFMSCTRPTLLEPEAGLEEEGQLETEYDLRLRTLEELKNHNHRLRHRMQRVAVDVREYELVCSSVMPALGIAYRSLPMELLDAFSHDPSAVTGGTRKRHGWRVVEDIHARVVQQRKVLTSFLSGLKTDVDAISTPENVLDKPISTLMEKLQALEREREPLQGQAEEVSRMLMGVRASHLTIKEEFNDALSYTSVVYPELSHIVALEESYKDQYQQVWELGMDALTFILDTIAPFWRNYGKIIGEDMQDFIIIPWYRNEFTGESKRYPVESVPRRSFRHWIALFFLCAFTCFITFLQARAAFTSAWHYRLRWIDNQAFRWTIMPFFWVVILIQWFALTFEVCVLLLYVTVVVWWLGWLIGIFT